MVFCLSGHTSCQFLLVQEASHQVGFPKNMAAQKRGLYPIYSARPPIVASPQKGPSKSLLATFGSRSGPWEDCCFASIFGNTSVAIVHP